MARPCGLGTVALSEVAALRDCELPWILIGPLPSGFWVDVELWRAGTGTGFRLYPGGVVCQPGQVRSGGARWTVIPKGEVFPWLGFRSYPCCVTCRESSAKLSQPPWPSGKWE